MSVLVVPSSQLLVGLANLLGAGGQLQHVQVKLFTNDVTPGPTSTLATFTEASFPGYSGSASITWNAPFLNVAGQAQASGDLHQFQPTDSTTPQNIYGWYGVGTGADSVNLKGAERFDASIFLGGPSNAVIVVPQVVLSETGQTIVEGT